MPFVLDASVATAWAIAEGNHPLAAVAEELIEFDSARVPSLWWFEVRNALVINERRHRLTEADTTAFLRMLSRLPIAVDSTPNEGQVLSLARRHKLTVYDAAYLELAQREHLSLATLDTKLARAARAEKVAIVEKPRSAS
ncbi:MAG: type II toxin-antitoxin system VapC family toxin [Candidatus Binataceae bacterium]